MDPTGPFVRDCVAKVPGAFVQAKIMYEAYVAWSVDASRKPVTNTKFGLLMKRKVKRDDTGRRHRYVDSLPSRRARTDRGTAYQGRSRRQACGASEKRGGGNRRRLLRRVRQGFSDGSGNGKEPAMPMASGWFARVVMVFRLYIRHFKTACVCLSRYATKWKNSLTYTRGKPSQPSQCAYNTMIDHVNWYSLDPLPSLYQLSQPSKEVI